MTGAREPKNIHDAVAEICDVLGIDYGAVGRLVIDPSEVSVSAHVFKRNDAGNFFVDPDTKEVAAKWRHFRVTT